MIFNQLKIISELIKYKVSLAVSFTSATGYFVFSHQIDFRVIALLFAVFLLASGASALNECQEYRFDALMDRTKNRPIPTGKISINSAWIISIAFTIAGLVLLFLIFNTTTAFLGFSNIIWYNVIYTNLKRISPFAVVPGSMVGAIPVLMGWTAAGGYVFDKSIIFIAFFIFIWQIPHFWLLMFKYGKQYEDAGFKTINQTMSPDVLRIVIFSWVLGTSASSMLVPLFLPTLSIPLFLIIFALNIIFIIFFIRLSFGNIAETNFRRSFMSINIYMFAFMIMMIIYHVLK